MYKRTGLKIKKVSDGIEKKGNAAFKPQGLTVAQIDVMMLIQGSEKGSSTLAELQTELEIAQPTILGTVKRLESKGFIESYQEDTKKRTKSVRLTPMGQNACRLIKLQLLGFENSILKGFTAAEKTEFLRLLDKAYANIKK